MLLSILTISEQYVRAQRCICAQLRLSILPSALKTGCFHSVPEEDGKSHLCYLDEVKSEMHFIFYCSFYHALWVKLLLKMYARHPSPFDMTYECRLKDMFKFSFVKCLLNVWERCMFNLVRLYLICVWHMYIVPCIGLLSLCFLFSLSHHFS